MNIELMDTELGMTHRGTAARRQRRYRLGTLLLAAWLGVLGSLLPLASSVSQAGHASVPPGPEAEQVALTINRLRGRAGLPPLTVHPLLTQAAAAHIQDMITSGQYGHTGSDGSNVHQRIARTGYVVDGWAGEIWAAYQDVESAFRAWMDSPPHRESILNPYYTEMGVATHPRPGGGSLIVVVDFATGSSNQPPGVLPTADAVLQKMPDQAPIGATDLVYTVQPGDTLFAIGERYGMWWQEIAAANRIAEGTVLQIGQKLTLPGAGDGNGGPEERADASRADSETTYTVQPGDTLIGIASRFGGSWEALAAANGLSADSVLQIGDRLRIPDAPLSTGADRPRSHVVAPGDTVVGIAGRYGVDWQEVLALNGLAPDSLLRIGQVIRLP